MSNILVTGSQGQVGKAFKNIPKSNEDQWFFTDRKTLDITNRSAVHDFFEDHDIDIIINCAAYTAVDQAQNDVENCYLVNKKAVGNLAEACAKNNGVLVHISTDYVYNPNHNNPISEDELVNPDGAYAQSKFEGEKLALDLNPNTIIIRTSWVYDEQGNNFVNTMLRLGATREELNVVSDQIGSPTYAADIAAVILKILDNTESNQNYSGIYNFSNSGYISWYEFAKEIMSIAKLSCKINPIPSSAYPTPAKRPLNSRLDKSKINSTFGIELKSWKESLKTCLKNKSKAEEKR